MEVILLTNQKNLGKIGDTVTVRDGFARNFLLPYGHAALATKENLAELEQRRAELEAEAAAQLAAAQKRAESFAGLTVVITARASDEGKLFGSIGVRDIAEAITKQGVEVVKREVILSTGPIRDIGEYEILLQLHDDVQATITVKIEAAQDN